MLNNIIIISGLVGFFFIFFFSIYIDKGLSLGLISCQLLLFLHFLGLPLQPLPWNVLLIMLAVLTATGCWELAGGLDDTIERFSLLKISEISLTFLSATIIYMLVWMIGTGYIIYPFIPIIIRTAIRIDIAPVRPTVFSIIAARQSILSSPMSSAFSVLLDQGYPLVFLIKKLFPINLLALWISIFIMEYFFPIPKLKKKQNNFVPIISKKNKINGKPTIWLIIGLITVIIRLFFFPLQNIPTCWFVSLVIFSLAGMIVITEKISLKKLPSTSIFSHGIQAIVNSLGLMWLGNSWLIYVIPAIEQWVIKLSIPGWIWLPPLIFFMTMITYSQSATLYLVFPLIQKFLQPFKLIWVFLPILNAHTLFFAYPSLVVAAESDPSSTISLTNIWNHSFLWPSLLNLILNMLLVAFFEFF